MMNRYIVFIPGKELFVHAESKAMAIVMGCDILRISKVQAIDDCYSDNRDNPTQSYRCYIDTSINSFVLSAGTLSDYPVIAYKTRKEKIAELL